MRASTAPLAQAHRAFRIALVVSVGVAFMLAIYMLSTGQAAGAIGLVLLPFGLAAFVSGLVQIFTSQSAC